MDIVSWNIQSGLGCDGIRDLQRIGDFIRSWSAADVICLQEIARYIAEYTSAGADDQLHQLRDMFPGYTACWGPGMRWHRAGGPPLEFGNLTLVKGTVLDWRVHILPRPPAPGHKQMVRTMVETVVATSGGPLTVCNTHLAYYSGDERQLQVDYINEFQRQQEESALHPPAPGDGAWANLHRTAKTLLCGDCNFTPGSREYETMTAFGWQNGWHLAHPGVPHEPTCGCHDAELWPAGPHCRDFFWLSGNLIDTVASCRVDTAVSFSDHQPIEIRVTV